MKSRLLNVAVKVVILPSLMISGGCAFDRGLVTLNPVGPKSSAAPGGNGPGHLIVDNASHEALSRDGAMTYPHDDYRIFDERKICVKHVRNASGPEGEIPARVDLPPGRYTVITESEIQGAVAVPIIIKSDLTTEVKLEQPRRTVAPNSTAFN